MNCRTAQGIGRTFVAVAVLIQAVVAVLCAGCGTGREVAVETLTVPEAARIVAWRPAADRDARVDREIELYAALYRTAYTSNIGQITEHYLLDPPDDPPEQWYPDGVEIEGDELRLRVLARLNQLEVPMRWTPDDAPTTLTEPVYFPDTQKLATRLGVRLIERVEEDDNGRPSVRAMLTDATAHVGGSRQYVTAVWDGEQWRITRDRAFQVW